jgi:hypothetical protein
LIVASQSAFDGPVHQISDVATRFELALLP